MTNPSPNGGRWEAIPSYSVIIKWAHRGTGAGWYSHSLFLFNWPHLGGQRVLRQSPSIPLTYGQIFNSPQSFRCQLLVYFSLIPFSFLLPRSKLFDFSEMEWEDLDISSLLLGSPRNMLSVKPKRYIRKHERKTAAEPPEREAAPSLLCSASLSSQTWSSPWAANGMALPTPAVTARIRGDLRAHLRMWGETRPYCSDRASDLLCK